MAHASTSASTPLGMIEPLIHKARGALFEGDVMSVARFCPFAVRFIEFCMSDAGLDCSAEYDPEMSLTDRFWNLYQRQLEGSQASDIGLVDVKSSVNERYLTTIGQRRRVVLTICVTARDPSYVHVIPNFFQEAAALMDGPASEWAESDRRQVAVTFSRTSRMPPSAYGFLDPVSAAYRMPMKLLPQALSMARAHIRGEAVYENPYTKVRFYGWKPLTTTNADWLMPQNPGNKSACSAFLDIYQAFKYGSIPSSLRPGLVGLAPRLADFWLGKYLVQHKLKDHPLGPSTRPNKMEIARGDYWYFAAHDRFDFLWFQFEISRLPENPRPRVDFFLLPERVLPDSFYIGEAKHADFDIDAFNIANIPDEPGRTGFRVHMDEQGEWVRHVSNIVEANPNPRRPGERPWRSAKQIMSSELAAICEAGEHEAPGGQPVEVKGFKSDHGRHLYEQAMARGQRHFFYRTMAECARRRQGLLVVLGRNHPHGDFAYCRYAWTALEQQQFLEHRLPPRTLHTLPPGTPLHAVCHYSRHTENSHHGPNVTAAEFRRLNSCAIHRVMFWDLGGADASQSPLIPVAIPSEDIQPSASQRQIFEANLALDKDDWKAKTPSLTSLLRTNLNASEYAVHSAGPLAFGYSGWGKVWALLENFAGPVSFEHPSGHQRDPSRYRLTLATLHERTLQEHLATGSPEEDEGDGR